MNYLSFDVGTTCCKCQLFSEDGNILEYLIKEYEFKKVCILIDDQDKSYVTASKLFTIQMVK